MYIYNKDAHITNLL